MDERAVRKWGPRILLAAAVAAVAIALIIGYNRYGPGGQWSLSQANGICTSVFGQAAQVTSTRAAANCSSITAAEQARGWLLIGGILAGVIALGWNVYESRQRQADTAR
jgi:hypothetical protein